MSCEPASPCLRFMSYLNCLRMSLPEKNQCEGKLFGNIFPSMLHEELLLMVVQKSGVHHLVGKQAVKSLSSGWGDNLKDYEWVPNASGNPRIATGHVLSIAEVANQSAHFWLSGAICCDRWIVFEKA